MKKFSVDPRDRARKRASIFDLKIEKAIKSPNVSGDEANCIRHLIGKGGAASLLIASDLPARTEASDKLADLIAKLVEQCDRKVRFFFITLTDDNGIVSDRVPVFDLSAIQKKVYRAMRLVQMDAICVIELHPVMNYPAGGRGRTILAHVHAIAWTGKKLTCAEVEDQILAGGSWKTSLGAKPVVVKRIKLEPEDIEETARYMVKPPHSAKNRIASKKYPGRFRLLNTLKGYRPELALRMTEILSQIEFNDLVFGVNGGAKVRQQLRAHMTAWHRARLIDIDPLPGEFDTWLFWYSLRQQAGSKNFLPVRLISGGARMRQVRVEKRKRPGRPVSARSRLRSLTASRRTRSAKPNNRTPRSKKS